jgi:hypothetical protein
LKLRNASSIYELPLYMFYILKIMCYTSNFSFKFQVTVGEQGNNSVSKCPTTTQFDASVEQSKIWWITS